jgi:hypothetical protein
LLKTTIKTNKAAKQRKRQKSKGTPREYYALMPKNKYIIKERRQKRQKD